MVREAVVLGLIGAATGLCAGVIVRPFVAGVAGDASTGPVSIGGTVAVLLVVISAAAWIPARRAGRLEPTVALETS